MQVNSAERDVSIFENPQIEEQLRAADGLRFRVISTEPDPDHPTRPVINFVGGFDQLHIEGYVKMTPDSEVRWHLVSNLNYVENIG